MLAAPWRLAAEWMLLVPSIPAAAGPFGAPTRFVRARWAEPAVIAGTGRVRVARERAEGNVTACLVTGCLVTGCSRRTSEAPGSAIAAVPHRSRRMAETVLGSCRRGTAVCRSQTVVIRCSGARLLKRAFAKKHHLQRRGDDEKHHRPKQHAAHHYGGQRSLHLAADAC